MSGCGLRLRGGAIAQGAETFPSTGPMGVSSEFSFTELQSVCHGLSDGRLVCAQSHCDQLHHHGECNTHTHTHIACENRT